MLNIYEIFYEILFFISILGLIIGMFNPRLVIPLARTKTRFRAIFIYGIASLILFVLISIVVSIRTERENKRIIIYKKTLTSINF